MKATIFASLALILCSCQSSPLKMLVGTYTVDNSSQGVYLFDFDQDNASWRLLDTARAGNPSFVIPSSDRQFAYSVGEYEGQGRGAYSYRLTDNTIDVINYQCNDGRYSGASPCNIIVAGGCAITSNYTGGSVSAFPVKSDGSLGGLCYEFSPEPDSTGAVPHMHCAVLSPEGKYLFVTDLGLDAIYRFAVADPLEEQTVAVQFDRSKHPGPRHMVFSADGRFAYLLDELSDELTVMTYDDGKLTPVSTILAYDGDGHGSADLHISPDGRFLYTSHRLRWDGISIFSLDPETGLATKAGFCPTGPHPRNFAITPNGRYILCACRDAVTDGTTDHGRIEIYSIDRRTGQLQYTGKSIVLPAPVCVQLY